MSSKDRGIRVIMPYNYDDASDAYDALLQARENKQVQFNFVVCEGGLLIVGFDEPPHETTNGDTIQRICVEEGSSCYYAPVQAVPNLGSAGDSDPSIADFVEAVELLLKSLTPHTSRLGFVLGRYWAITDLIEDTVVLEVGFGGRRLIADVAALAEKLVQQLEIPFDLHYRGQTVEVEPGHTTRGIVLLIENRISRDLIRELAAGAATMLLEINMLDDGPLPGQFAFYELDTPGQENPYEEGLSFRFNGFSVTRAVFRPKDEEEDVADTVSENNPPEGDAPSGAVAEAPEG